MPRRSSRYHASRRQDATSRMVERVRFTTVIGLPRHTTTRTTPPHEYEMCHTFATLNSYHLDTFRCRFIESRCRRAADIVDALAPAATPTRRDGAAARYATLIFGARPQPRADTLDALHGDATLPRIALYATPPRHKRPRQMH